MWFLEETLADISHNFLVFSDFGGNSDQSAEFGRQIDILAFLSDFKEGLINGIDLDVVCRVEIIYHVCSGAFISVVENVLFRIHVPFDLVHLVSPVRAVLGHDDGALEFAVDEGLVVPLKAVLD
jgi:hypothetical protein